MRAMLLNIKELLETEIRLKIVQCSTEYLNVAIHGENPSKYNDLKNKLSDTQSDLNIVNFTLANLERS